MLFVCIVFLLPPGAGGPGPVENRVLSLVNKHRRAHDRGDLRWNEKLAEAARAHSRRMAEANFFGHEDPERGTLSERLAAAGIRRPAVAENLHRSNGYADPAHIAVEGWMKSRGHRRNMLDGSFRETGIGAARARDGTWYVTQLFAN
jgi:uncharacterized protein YkwD